MRARVAKMSRISSARSITRLPIASSMFLPWVGDSSSSNKTSDASVLLRRDRAARRACLCRGRCPGAGGRSAASARRRRPRPAVSASSASSRRWSSVTRRAPGRLRGRAHEERAFNGRRDDDRFAAYLRFLVRDSERLSTETRGGESALRRIRHREVPDRRSHGDVAEHVIRYGPSAQQATTRGAHTRVRKAHRNGDSRRIVVLTVNRLSSAPLAKVMLSPARATL